MKRIDINCDMGESYGRYVMGNDAALMPYVKSANIACGFHAGDPCVMEQTVALADAAQVCVGAHPGYPDLNGFGRRVIALSPEELEAITLYQIGALKIFLDSRKMKLHHVKPHGALYNTLITNEPLSKSFIEAMKKVGEELFLYFVGSVADNCLQYYADKAGFQVIREFNCDTDYGDDGSIIVRKQYGHISVEESVERTMTFLKTGSVKSVNGKELKFEADSLCVHGDNPKTQEAVVQLTAALEKEGYQISSPSL